MGARGRKKCVNIDVSWMDHVPIMKFLKARQHIK